MPPRLVEFAMTAKHRHTAEVSIARQAQGIRWLALEDDPRSSGWFLFLHRASDEACTFDSWHLSRDDAIEEARRHWGVVDEDWRPPIR